MNYLTREGGKAISAQLPLQVDDVTASSDRTSISAETVTFASAAAAGSTGVNALDKAPILNLTGDKVGSYWGEDQNRMISYHNQPGTLVGAVTETNGSASVVITDVNNNLEKRFEAASGNRRYIVKVIDDGGNYLHGWIGDITVSGNAYTIPAHNAVTSGSQNWVGTLADFDGTAVRVEIYSYESSFAWVTGTVLTREVALDEEALQDTVGRMKFFDGLSDGDYAINYRTAAIYFKKATTGTSDTCNYSHPGGGGGGASLVDDGAFTPGSDFVSPVGFFFDDTATDSVNEGDIGAARMSGDRKILVAGSYVDDAAFTPAGANSYGIAIGGEADDTATDSVDEGDYGVARISLRRALYTSMDTLLAGEDQTNNVSATVRKPLAVNTYAWSHDDSVAYEASTLSKASAGHVRSIEGYNSKASAQFIQLHNASSVPADTAVPEMVITVPATSNFSIDFGEDGYYCDTGIVACNSSTGPTKTVGAADVYFTIRYI